MSFWKNIASYIGPAQFGVELGGKLALEKGQGGWVAGLSMNTFKVGNDYLLSNADDPNEVPVETVPVYFLSWKVDDESKVTFETLKNFNYFLTSEFSGCRFVVTDRGVAHIAWSAGGDRSQGIGTQQLRDQTEYISLSYNQRRPDYRRSLSISATPGQLDRLLESLGTNNNGQSYGNDRALVFGYRVEGGWAFKVLRFEEAKGSATGTWSNFACVWTS